MTILTTRAVYTDGAAVEIQISSLPDVLAVDPKDALMEDPDALQAMYAEFAPEDRQLAQSGLAHYAHILQQEESSA